jgi:hemoglobin-like flavoprotein
VPDGAQSVTPGARPDRADASTILSSLEVAAARGGDLTPRVYEVLFAREPQLRELFWRDTDGVIKGEMLMKVIEAILDFIGDRRYAHHLISAEAMNHEGFSVPRTVFATFFGVVFEVVRETCGVDWTDAMAAAWGRTLVDLDHALGIRERLVG